MNYEEDLRQPTVDEVDEATRRHRSRIALGVTVTEFFLNCTEYDADTDKYSERGKLSPEVAQAYAPALRAVLDSTFDPAECTGLQISSEQYAGILGDVERIGLIVPVEPS